MEQICDLHIHSKYSGGTSNNINLFNIAFNCRKKGINIIGTGDCLHPLWLNELKNKLIENSDGVYCTQQVPEVKFILQTEIEAIWNINSNIKKVHFIVLIPNFEKLEEVIELLSRFGKLNSDGRPKIYNSAEKLILRLKNIDSDIEIIPAHIFTPFYGVLGDKPQFNSIKEALGQGITHIHAIETGLSADPVMIRMLSELNNFSIISNSDSHSVNFHRIGREATVLNINKLDYRNLIDCIKRNKIIKTYEFKPSEGKYYYDGHRPERHSNGKDYFCSPKRNIRICPYCGKELTKGVLSRVYELSDQEYFFKKQNFQYIVPLLHLIAIVLGGNEYTKRNLSIYQKIIKNNKGEYNIWNGKNNFDEIPEKIFNAIYNVKIGKYWFIPGHDGVYGKLKFDL